MSLEGLYHKEKSLLEFLNSHVDDLCVHLDGDELPESSVASLVSMAKDAADHVPAYNKLLADLGKSKADLEFAQVQDTDPATRQIVDAYPHFTLVWFREVEVTEMWTCVPSSL